MKLGLKYVFGALVLATIVVTLVYFLGVPKSRATGSPILVLTIMSLGCLVYGAYLFVRTAQGGDEASPQPAPRRSSKMHGKWAGVAGPRQRKLRSQAFSAPRRIARYPLAPDSVPGRDLRLAGPRHILAPSFGIAFTIGEADLNGGGVFAATAYTHPGFVGLERFPSISNPEFADLRIEQPFLLRPLGFREGFTSLSLDVLISDSDPRSPARWVGSGDQGAIRVGVFTAQVVPLLPELPLWKRYARDGRLRSIILPKSIALAMQELGLPSTSGECRFLTAPGE